MPKNKDVDIWMPLYISKYLGDTRSFTTVDHGAYLLLLMEMWIRDGYLNNDTETLKIITGLTPKKFNKTWPKIKSLLFQNDRGKWYSPKLLKELEKAKNYKKMTFERAVKAAEARWKEHAKSNASSNPPSMLCAGEGTGKGKIKEGKEFLKGTNLDEQYNNLFPHRT